jgi:hypothetical protein
MIRGEEPDGAHLRFFSRCVNRAFIFRPTPVTTLSACCSATVGIAATLLAALIFHCCVVVLFQFYPVIHKPRIGSQPSTQGFDQPSRNAERW